MDEAKHRAIFTSIFKKHAGSIKLDKAEPCYAQESTLLKSALAAERNAWLFGIGSGLFAFATLHYLPNAVIRRIGSVKKIRALDKSQKASFESQHGWIQRGVTVAFEGVFASYVGVAGYRRVSKRGSAYDEIAGIPLVEGRSFASELMCEEWVSSYGSVPEKFRIRVKEEKLHDQQTWTAISQFAQNCVSRDLYEKKIREEKGMRPDEPVVIPSPGVPRVVLKDLENKEIAS